MSGIAFETIHYAIECVGSGERTLALETIDTEGMGLTLEQQTAARGIIESAGELRDGRELSRFGNRLLSVLQPATFQFLENPQAIASVMLYFRSSENDFIPTVEVLGIQTSHFNISQSHLRQRLKEKTTFFLHDFNVYVNNLRDLETSKPLNMGEVLALCPDLEEFITLGGILQATLQSRLLEPIGEALKEGKNPKFCKFTALFKFPIEEIRKLKAFPQLTQFVLVNDATSEEIQAVLELPHLKSLELRDVDAIADHLHLLQNTQLESIAFWWSGSPFFQEERLQILSTVPLKVLKFTYSEHISDEDLPRLLRIPTLETLDLSACTRLTKNGLVHFLRLISASPLSKIKKVILKVPDDGMTLAEMREIIREFPQLVGLG